MTDDEEDELTAASRSSSTTRCSGPRSRRCPTRPRSSTASSRRRPSSTPPTTSNGREDLPPGDQRRAPAGDAPRPARLRARRGRRRLRRRVQGDGRLPGGVRPLARDRHAALGDGDRRRRDRRGPDGHAARRRDAVRRLRLVRLGSPRHGRREAALPRRDADPDRAAPALGRRLLGRPVPLPEPGEPVRPRAGSQGRLPGDARGRQGPARERDRGRQPGALLRAQAPLPPDQGRGARTSATRRRSARPASTGRATTSSSSPGAQWSIPLPRRRSASRPTASPSRCSTCAR